LPVNQQIGNGIWYQNDGVVSVQIPAPPMAGDLVKGRYQPWGLMPTDGFALAGPNAVVQSPYALDLKDPLVWGPDYWDFPTNLLSDLTELGQVHRGTPWQTVYLKAGDVLNTLDSSGDPGSGTNTWVAWTADRNVAEPMGRAGPGQEVDNSESCDSFALYSILEIAKIKYSLKQ
jgi:hypothetical protein